MQITENRRALHQIPELDRNLPKTMAYLTGQLEMLRCTVFSPMESSLCAWFDFGQASAIAFRADADALPIQEIGSCAYKSTHDGKMHACGHDGHMAVLLELARRLNEKETYPHNVLLLFQPAEETTGGAKDLCDTGIFLKYGVKAIFGLHLWPGLPKGSIASRKGELMSRSCEVNVDIYGKTAHIAKAAEGNDALAAAVTFYSRVTAMEQALPKQVFRLLKFGKLVSGQARNALSDHTHLEGSLRAFQDESFNTLRDGMITIARDVEQETGCRVQIATNDGYPAVINPDELYDRVRNVVSFEELDAPSMTAEDFSWYQKYIPGVFFFLGTGDTPALHAANFDFDEEILLKGADFFEELGEKLI